MRRPSGRSFLIDVGEVLRHPGTQTALALAGPLPGVALSSARLVDDAEVRFDGTVEAQGTTVIVQGVGAGEWVGECRRCLEVTTGQVQMELREVFEVEPVEGETFPLVDERVDLEPVLREAFALALPVAPLCSEDCAGPDPEGHPVGGPNGHTSPESSPARDPRWAALDQLHLDR